jgi:uncharacterized protein (TIGR02996 family)
MTTPADVFLKTICDEPDDDAVRLIFADWLQEQGDAHDAARAAFIQTQFMLEGLPPEDERRPELEAYEKKLLDRYRRSWTDPLASWVEHYEFRRGFVEQVRITAADFLACGEELFRSAPVRSVRLTNINSSIGVLDSYLLRRIRELNLSSNWLGPLEVRRLTASRHRFQLSSLILDHNNVGVQGTEALASAVCLSGLEGLSLERNLLDSNGAKALCATRTLESLTRLNLSRNPIGPAGVRALVRARCLGRLRYLDLSFCQLGTEGAQRIARDAFRMRPEELILAGNRIGKEGVTALASSPYLGHLRILDLRQCDLGPDDIEPLTVPNCLTALSKLNLAGNRLGDEGARRLAGASWLTGLTRLDLGRNGIGVQGATALASSSSLAGIRRLGLAGGLTEGAAHHLRRQFGSRVLLDPDKLD